MERGRITTTAVTTMVNLRSVYQGPLTKPSGSWATAAITATKKKQRGRQWNILMLEEGSVNRCAHDICRWQSRWLKSQPLHWLQKTKKGHQQAGVKFLQCQYLSARKCRSGSHERQFTEWKKKLSGVLFDALCPRQWLAFYKALLH